MKILLFTSNNPRHLSLVERCAKIADEVFLVQECTTVFPGRVQDFYNKSQVMQNYFSRVIAAEKVVFGQPRFLPKNVSQLPLRMGDVSMICPETFHRALEADCIIVFGASYIRPPLVDLLVQRRAVNIHMGISPFYRGSACNFWALYDDRPYMVGATIHLLSHGLDNGPILFHVRPAIRAEDPFVFGMKAVKAAQCELLQTVSDGSIHSFPVVEQDRSQQLRYTRTSEFTDAVALEYLSRNLTPEKILSGLSQASDDNFVRLRYGA